MWGGGLGFVVVFGDFGNKLGCEDMIAANLRERFACFCFPNRPKGNKRGRMDCAISV